MPPPIVEHPETVARHPEMSARNITERSAFASAERLIGAVVVLVLVAGIAVAAAR
jgi:hypothetical protein